MSDDVIIHKHFHEPPPLLVTDSTCLKEGFPSVRAWRKFARAAITQGFTVSELGEELTMLRSDVEAFHKSRGITIQPKVDPDFVDLSEAIARAGLRVVG